MQVVLTTLGGYVEWVATSHLVAEGGRLLQVLCLLLKDDTCDKVQLAAAECLLQVRVILSTPISSKDISFHNIFIIFSIKKIMNKKQFFQK